MSRLELLRILERLGECLDRDGLYNEAKVVDKALRENVLTIMSSCKVEAEERMVRNWITYNNTASEVRLLNDKVAALRGRNEYNSTGRGSG